MLTITARPNSTRGQSNEAARTPQTEALVVRPASGQPVPEADAVVLQVRPQRPDNRFLSALLRALSAFAA
jgi:hypothetical protein